RSITLSQSVVHRLSVMDLKAPSHFGRNAAVGAAVLASIAGVWIYSRHSATQDASRMERFDTFRAAYAEKCNVPSYAGPVADVVRDDYLTSVPIQAEIDRQLAALNAGASCDEVAKKLKAVDLAVPPPGPAQ